VMLPCNVIVQETDDKRIRVSAINPLEAMRSVGNEKLNDVAAQVSEKLARVIGNI
jgi:uncharacterized protein (DUF302 family)